MTDSVSALSSQTYPSEPNSREYPFNNASPQPTFGSAQNTYNSSQQAPPTPAHSPLYPVDPVQETAKPGLHKPGLLASAGSIDYNHPDIQSPGLESAWTAYDGDAGKEVVPQPEYPPDGYAYHPGSMSQGRPRRCCGFPIWICVLFIILAVLLVLGVGLGVGLGIGLKKTPMGAQPAFNPNYLSKSGAFNGTGIAIASYSFDKGGYGVINVYYQHHNGQIRKIQLNDDGTWFGGDATTIIATDAKNGTPISAVAYAMDNTSKWHLFYINKQNVVKERISDNRTNTWRDGPIGDLNLTAMDHPNVGLQACWYGSFYGTANYTHSPIPGTGQNTTAQDSVIGMHLWYGKDPHTLEEVNWTYNTTAWFPQDHFHANGHAGVGCYSWGPGSVSYVMMVNLENEINVMWKDLNATVAATDTHPVGVWSNTSVSIPHVMPNTSLGYTNFFYTQLDDRSIAGYNISWDAENTKIIDSDTFKIPQKPLAGTHFSVTAIPTKSGGNSLMVFNQGNGTDITQNVRDLSVGSWTYNTLPIPPDQ